MIMKKYFLFLLVSLLTCANVSAYSFMKDGICYDIIDSSDGSLCVSVTYSRT